MIEEEKKNYPENEEIFHPAENLIFTRKKVVTNHVRSH